MAYQIELSPTAISDIGSAVFWMQEKLSPEKAGQWLMGCYGVIESLEQFPDRCPRSPEADYLEMDIRQIKYSSFSIYRILFTVVPPSAVHEGIVRVHRVRHNSQERLRTLDEL
jgi:plasmid stabilization system protein ParE